jgi:hypothetical protein
MAGVFAKGKRSMAISDRSGMAFPYREMVREWNGFLVHYRLRGTPVVTASGPGGSDPADNRNMQQFATVPTIDNVSDIGSASGFTITVGQKQTDGSVVTAAGTLTSPENYFFFTSSDTATSGNVTGGGQNNSAGPVTLGVVNG